MISNFPIIHSGTDLQWYCQCGDAMRALMYPIDLTKDSVEIMCASNINCEFYRKVVCVRFERREVIYVRDNNKEV